MAQLEQTNDLRDCLELVRGGVPALCEVHGECCSEIDIAKRFLSGFSLQAPVNEAEDIARVNRGVDGTHHPCTFPP